MFAAATYARVKPLKKKKLGQTLVKNPISKNVNIRNIPQKLTASLI